MSNSIPVGKFKIGNKTICEMAKISILSFKYLNNNGWRWIMIIFYMHTQSHGLWQWFI